MSKWRRFDVWFSPPCPGWGDPESKLINRDALCWVDEKPSETYSDNLDYCQPWRVGFSPGPKQTLFATFDTQEDAQKFIEWVLGFEEPR